MGLAASQGRLLLLTAKKSDLEFRAQSISQSRLVLAQQQESISRKYAEKTSNRCLKFKSYANGEDGKTGDPIALTFDALWSSTTDIGGKQQRPIKLALPTPNENGDMVMVISKLSDLTGPGMSYENQKITNLGDGHYRTPDGCEWYVDKKLQNDSGDSDSYLKYALENGIYHLAKTNTETGKWERTTIAGESGFTDEYYTDDDAEAKADYDMEMTKVKIKDQRLELDLKGVETQHKAVETETESVQKIIQKNVEVGFKTFS